MTIVDLQSIVEIWTGQHKIREYIETLRTRTVMVSTVPKSFATRIT